MTRTQTEITLGILFVMATSFILLVYGLREEDRMAATLQQQQAQAIEVGADLFDTYCSRCHAVDGTGIQGLCPPLNDRYFFDQRLKDVGWSGTQEDYIVATASSGRLASTRPDQYPGAGTPAMPAFSDQYGGPLRVDQIRSIATFVMNWEETAIAIEPPPASTGPIVGTDITQELPEGDAAHGEELATSIGCTACHVLAPTGPAWMATGDQPGVGARAEARFTEPDYTGSAQDAHQYLLESIVNPGVFLVPGFTNLMPPNYGQTLTPQDTADLIAYLSTLR